MKFAVRPRVLAGICAVVLVGAQGCKKPAKSEPPVKLTLIDLGFLDYKFQSRHREELRQFTKESGIEIEVLPAPESPEEIATTFRKLLESRATVPDVYAIDAIWPKVLADNLVDLRSYVPAPEITTHFPQLVENYSVNGRLVALPYAINIGMLFYRPALLRRYGYREPPKTWEDLESMAARIQRGERAKGKKDFWGFVWQGALTETLTCNALEWQVSEGGGTIIENGRITVNNPRTIRAWERAARWVGSISPPGVVAYKRGDALNMWQAGRTAFMRNWSQLYPTIQAEGADRGEDLGIAPLPAGQAATAATIGGHGYGVSQHSLHRREAVMLVRFLCRRDVQLARCRYTASPPTVLDLYQDPQVMAANPYFSPALDAFQKGAAWRPSTLTGKAYPAVSRAYFEAVHSVLTGKKSAAGAAAELEDTLVRTTHLKPSDTSASTHSTDRN